VRAARIPQRQRAVRAIQDQRQALGRTEPIGEQDAREGREPLVAPFAVAVQPFNAVEWTGLRVASDAAAPDEVGLERRRVGDDRHRAEPLQILQHVVRFAAQRVRRFRQIERDHMAAGGAHLHRVDRQHAGSVLRTVRGARGVAVIGQDHEREPGARRGGRHVVRRAGPVRVGGVDVHRAAEDRC
jgi:hypothetical protein